MVCSVVSIVAIRCATASLSRNPTPKCFWCSVHRFLCPCNSGIACRDPSSKCLWCSVHRFLCLEQWSSVPQQWNSCQNLDFLLRSGVAFGGRETVGGCFVTPCQGVFLIRRVSCGLACVPGTIACQTLDFFIRFRSDVWPGQRHGRRLFRHAAPGCFPDLKGVLWLGLCAWNNCLPDP